ncbi:hypothetical protein AGR4C_Cc150066 [Agrobacterium tumefaciens str. Kerr 14]|uniref:Uncharacterized protein n=1 Tax=Agrobacterium tumefaciens str. Kerr 14 TaxID=1183424 RepID=A0A1S7P0W5_AGRTU|nr:hypothetical protein AGR4C_Cc150066 [Agrobacterium tumefaciens str. Kerr 14]
MRCIHKGFFSPSFLKQPALKLVLLIFDNTNIPRKSYFLVIRDARANSTAIVRFFLRKPKAGGKGQDSHF